MDILGSTLGGEDGSGHCQRVGARFVERPFVIGRAYGRPAWTKQTTRTREKILRLKTKLVAGAGSLVLATSMMAMAAPAAHAVVTHAGNCTGQVSLVKLSSPVKGVGLTDQTQRSIKVSGALAKDQTSKLVVNGGGTCNGVY